MSQKELGEIIEDLWKDPCALASMLGDMADRILQGYDPGEAVDHMALLSAIITARQWSRRWRNLDLAHVDPTLRLWVLSRLTFPTALPYLTQEVFNFLTLADMPTRLLGVYSKDDSLFLGKSLKVDAGLRILNHAEMRAGLIAAYSMDHTEVRLAQALRDQLMAESRPYEAKVYTGTLIMDRVPFAHLDQHIAYDTLRLVIVPTGIFCSVVKDNECFAPFFWNAPGRTHMPFLNKVQVDLSLDVLMAGIWRDACVVKKKFVQERTYKDPRPRSGKKSNKVVLPREIREVVWAEERERTGITHSAHTVRPHYRELPQDWKTSEEAIQKAKGFGYPEPPSGFTFIPPHVRGRGEAALPDYREVVCRGLLTVFTAIG